MRYDENVYFFSRSERKYNPDTGQMDDIEEDLGMKRCSVNDLSTERTTQLFGRSNVGAISIHHQGEVVQADRVKWREKVYYISSKRRLRNKASYIATESRLP